MCPTRTVGTIGIRRRISFLLTVLSFLAADGPFGSVFNRLVIADDELNPAKNHVVQVMMNRGSKVIERCQVSYSVTYTTPKPTEAAINESIEANKKLVQGLIARASGNEERASLEAVLAGIDKDIRQQMVANSKSTKDVFFAMDGPSLGGDRYFEITEHYGHAGRGPPRPYEVVYRTLGVDEHVAIRSVSRAPTAVIQSKRMFLGTEEPHRLGRAMGRIEQMADASDLSGESFWGYVREVRLEAGDPVQEMPTLRLNVIFGKAEGNTFGSAIVTTIPGMGYVTPEIREMAADGTLLEEIHCSGYVPVQQASGGSLWFPLKVESTRYDRDGAELESFEYRFKADAISLNLPVGRDRFAISLAAASTVADTRNNPSTSFLVREATTLGVDDVDSLSTNVLFERATTMTPRSFGAANVPVWRWPRWLVVNLAAVAILIGALWWRRRVAAILLLMMVAPGCSELASQASARSSIQRESGLIITPEALDFGTLSSSSQVRRKILRIENAEVMPRRVTIDTSCGCLTVTPKTLDLNTGESATVTALLSPDGSAGLRQTKIIITSSTSPEADSSSRPDQRLERPVIAKAVITNEWHATPRRIVVANVAGRGSGTVTITAPQSDWGRITIGVVGRDVTWEESSRPSAHDDGNESHTFRVQVGSDQGGDRGLSFTIAGHDSPLLIVPILVSR